MTDESRMLQTIRQNIQAIRAGILEACAASGRDPEGVRLLAVSKTVDVPQMEMARTAGITDFAENRVQELTRKADILTGDLNWHMCGRLQTNKVRMLAGRNVLIHSLDRPELLQEMRRIHERTGEIWQSLVEVNVSGEESKAGVSPDMLQEFMRLASESGCVRIRGLMTIASADGEPPAIRKVFAGLRQLAVDIDRSGMDNICMDHLSMGMSGDYRIAVEEGATMIRIGTAIFGSRMG